MVEIAEPPLDAQSTATRQQPDPGAQPTGIGRFAFPVAVAVSVLVTAVVTFKYIHSTQRPDEDAAMLLRYASNLAHGGGIVWNFGEHPVDGATDFLFMVTIAGLAKLGLSVQAAALTINTAAHFLTIGLVFFAGVRYHRARWLALVSALYLAFGPGMVYVATYFGTTFFALFACVTWILAMEIRRNPSRWWIEAAFAVSGLVLGLIRPEGVLLAGFMLIAVIYAIGWRRALRTISIFIGVFLIFGGAYFLWRWNYFGHPLPNPYYKKGGGQLHLTSLKESVHNAVFLVGPFCLAFLFGWRNAALRKYTIFVAIPIVLFVSVWVLMSNEMNHFARFQYAIVPIVLVSWPGMIAGLREDFALPSLDRLRPVETGTAIAVACALVVALLYVDHRSPLTKEPALPPGLYEAGHMLADYSSRGYTMAVSEAGQLPLYSQWNAIDTWGLNDTQIVHDGRLTDAYLESRRPELIMFHAMFSPLDPETAGGYLPTTERGNGAEWAQMIDTLHNYATTHHYVLAAAFGLSPHDTHYYFVRPDFRDSAELVSRIRSMKYDYETGSGGASINYADVVHR